MNSFLDTQSIPQLDYLHLEPQKHIFFPVDIKMVGTQSRCFYRDAESSQRYIGCMISINKIIITSLSNNNYLIIRHRFHITGLLEKWQYLMRPASDLFQTFVITNPVKGTQMGGVLKWFYLTMGLKFHSAGDQIKIKYWMNMIERLLKSIVSIMILILIMISIQLLILMKIGVL